MLPLSDFDYVLPKELIAQTPIEPRDSSRLLVLENGKIQHRLFSDFPSYLQPGDVLVLNDTKVSALKLEGKKATGGGVELLVLSRTGTFATCLISGKNIREGTELIFGGGKLTAVVLDKRDDGKYHVEFASGSEDASSAEGREPFEKMLSSLSTTPLPPYIREKLDRSERYQTVYASPPGSAAAPTAGLHFTGQMLEKIGSVGVNIVYVTLHIGTGTFLHVTEEALKRGKLESEFFKIGKPAAETINNAIQGGGRLFVVGTSTMRALESSVKNGVVMPQSSSTELFIYPGYKFKLPVHALLTNFHLPRSTLIMLVCAYVGRERVFDAYKAAIEMKYRFYSFGDAMLIVP